MTGWWMLVAASAAVSDPERGRQVFEHWCAPCHAPGPGHPGTQSLAVKYGGTLPDALEQRTDLAPGITRYFVRHGVSIMPFFRETEIGEGDLRALADYLAKMRPARTR